MEAKDIIFHIPWRSFPNFSLKILVLCSARTQVFGVFIFPYFVLSWYILAQRLHKTFQKWKYFFSFSILKWHIIVQTNRNNKLFFETRRDTNKAPLMLIFFPGDCILLAKLIITCQSKQKTTN